VVAAFYARGAVGTNLFAATAAIAGLGAYAASLGSWIATKRVKLLPSGFALEIGEAGEQTDERLRS
jgi:hypothetical protein